MARSRKTLDCVVIGAGAAGVGIDIAMQHLGLKRFEIIDRHGVDALFARWPKEMRLITPSFPTNSIGMLDINSVAIGTSPGFNEFARYALSKNRASPRAR